MKTNESMEMYLETILVVTKEKGNCRSIDVAHEMNFSKPSVSVAMKNLRELGHINVENNGNLVLTESGRKIAEMIYERHNVLSNLLIGLGVPKDVAIEDACKMEHVISEESFDALKKHVYEEHPEYFK